MTALRLDPVGPGDAAAFDAWYDVHRAAEVAGRPHAAPLQREELRAALRAEPVRAWRQAWLGCVEGAPVVAGLVETPLLDNPDFAYLQVHTRPDARRQGHGSAMLAHLESVAADRGRSLLHAEAAWAQDADEAAAPGAAFLRARGFALGLVDVQRELDLPVPDERLAALAAGAAPHHTAYRLISWVGRCPDDLVASLAALEALVAVEAPMGELELEPDTADVGAYRHQEETLADQGRTRVVTVAVDAAGEVVAYSDAVVPAHDPGRVFQWGTLVHRAHRGHRLGLAVKVANLALLQREFPDRRLLTTYNAESNGPMIAVNDVLGFRPVERLGEFQKRQSLRSRT